MRAGTALATLIAAAIVAWGVLGASHLLAPLELVPPEPSFGVRDRVVVPSGPTPYEADQPSLRDLADEAGILIGAAVEPEDMAWEPLYNQTLAREFNAVATENVLKFGLMRKTENRYVFGPADMIVDFAAQNDMKVRGVTLVWHIEVPGWLSVQDLDREQTMAVLEEHIRTVVERYKGHIQYWDVLNEALDEDGTLRDTIWLEKIGPEYIDMVFRWAHEADPDARLFYNDYEAEDMGQKSDGVYDLVSGMLARGVPIHGVGMQGHFELDIPPSYDEIEANVQRLTDLGLEVQFTEFDVAVDTPVTDDKLYEQGQMYWQIFDICVQNPGCTAFITWGVTDKFSWIDRFLDGYSAGLAFDREYQAKPAYWALRDVLEQKLNLGPYAVD